MPSVEASFVAPSPPSLPLLVSPLRLSFTFLSSFNSSVSCCLAFFDESPVAFSVPPRFSFYPLVCPSFPSPCLPLLPASRNPTITILMWNGSVYLSLYLRRIHQGFQLGNFSLWPEHPINGPVDQFPVEWPCSVTILRRCTFPNLLTCHVQQAYSLKSQPFPFLYGYSFSALTQSRICDR